MTASAPPPAAALSPGTAALIVYVEDNDFIREAVTELLEGPGRDVRAFDDADAADALLGARAPALLVTDVNLRGASGLDLARRALQRRPRQAVLLCSGHALAAADLATLGPRVRSIPKPFGDDELRALVQEMLDDDAADA